MYSVEMTTALTFVGTSQASYSSKSRMEVIDRRSMVEVEGSWYRRSRVLVLLLLRASCCQTSTTTKHKTETTQQQHNHTATLDQGLGMA